MASIDELWLVDFGDPQLGEPASIRPAVVLGPPRSFGPEFPYVIVAPLTTTGRSLNFHVEVEHSPSTGLEATSYVQCEQLRSISTRRLVHRLGVIDLATHLAVDDVIRTLFDH